MTFFSSTLMCPMALSISCGVVASSTSSMSRMMRARSASARAMALVTVKGCLYWRCAISASRACSTMPKMTMAARNAINVPKPMASCVAMGSFLMGDCFCGSGRVLKKPDTHQAYSFRAVGLCDGL